MLVSEGGGNSTKISYDSSRTQQGAMEIQLALENYKTSNKHVISQFTSILGELEGETIGSYQQTVEDYVKASQLGEDSIETFLKLLELTEQQIQEAETKSQSLFRSITI